MPPPPTFSKMHISLQAPRVLYTCAARLAVIHRLAFPAGSIDSKHEAPDRMRYLCFGNAPNKLPRGSGICAVSTPVWSSTWQHLLTCQVFGVNPSTTMFCHGFLTSTRTIHLSEHRSQTGERMAHDGRH
ncbi:hypothetical protein CDEST_14736 [Colletotrichum destructivum]|uniref:Uncharacterized protein n=1 Tax=Colletotrichum destructivum TaxID=34406 RepID=A0AAX4J2G5_9PEZI|nr:hypothetical protein CDEST_14736 [Colletotrichum destructivum]